MVIPALRLANCGNLAKSLEPLNIHFLPYTMEGLKSLLDHHWESATWAALGHLSALGTVTSGNACEFIEGVGEVI